MRTPLESLCKVNTKETRDPLHVCVTVAAHSLKQQGASVLLEYITFHCYSILLYNLDTVLMHA